MNEPDQPAAGRRARTAACPICGKPPADSFRPFCSRRCADVDLNRWLGGVYAIPADEGPESDSGEAADGD